MARPVDAKFPISQLFAGLATRGIVGRPDGSEVEYLVWLYGDYQPYGHAGVDIACPVGTPIRAMRAGTIVWAGWGEDLPGDDSWGPSGYFRRWGMYKNFPGIVTVIQTGGVNEFDIYGHQSSNDEVTVGMHVTEGQIIGKSGNTKTRTSQVGPHLHVVTVADPVNYSTDWPRIIFGCVDPTPLFGGTGLILQGAITNAATTQAQEDEMSAEEVQQIRGDIATVHQTIIQDVGSQLGDLSKAVSGLPSLDRDLRAQLDGLPKFDQQVREDLAIKGKQITALTAAVDALTSLVGKEQGMDVAVVKQAVSEAIADGLKITVEAGGSNG